MKEKIVEAAEPRDSRDLSPQPSTLKGGRYHTLSLSLSYNEASVKNRKKTEGGARNGRMTLTERLYARYHYTATGKTRNNVGRGNIHGTCPLLSLSISLSLPTYDDYTRR